MKLYSTTKFQDVKPIERNFLLDLLKTIAIIGVIVDNSLGAQSEQFKLVGGYFWSGQGVPIFLIATGFLFSMSYERHRVTSLKDCYKPKTIINKILRFGIPYILFYIIEAPIAATVDHLTPLQLVGMFFEGGSGPGTYYLAVVFEIIFIFPLIFFFMKKFGFKGLVTMFFITLVWDLFAFGTTIIQYDGVYKRIIIREFFLLAAGAYAFLYKKEKYKWGWAIPSFIAGIFFITLVYYMNIPMHVNRKWFQVCELANLYIVPLILLLIKKVKMNNQPWWEVVGGATFNIFLTQIAWNHFINLGFMTDNYVAFVIINILCCIFIGIAFWLITEPLTKLAYRATNAIFKNTKTI